MLQKMTAAELRWRKATDIKREYAIFELVDVDDKIILDVSYSDEGVFEISFGYNSPAKSFEWDDFRLIVESGKALANRDKT